MIIGIVGAMLLVVAFVFGGGPNTGDFFDAYAKQVEKSIKQVVEDDDRKKAALDSVEGTRIDIKATIERSHPIQMQLRKIDLQYDASLNDYLEADKKIGAEVAKQLEIVADSHFEMREILTAEEWDAVVHDFSKKVGKSSKKLLKAMEKSQRKRVKKWNKRLKD